MTAKKKSTKTKSPKTKPQRIAIGQYVVIATSSRPWTVAAGYYDGEDEQGRVYLRDARQIVYWARDSRGLFGVAERGIVNKQGRVTPVVALARYKNEEQILIATDAARKSIEADPWI